MSGITVVFFTILALTGLFFLVKFLYKLFVLEIDFIRKHWPVVIIIFIVLILLAVFGDIFKGIFSGIFH